MGPGACWHNVTSLWEAKTRTQPQLLYSLWNWRKATPLLIPVSVAVLVQRCGLLNLLPWEAEISEAPCLN